MRNNVDGRLRIDWNATSMMNNWYFRVAILHSSSSSQITFEHPTLAGVNNGGWMERKKELGENILQPTFKPSQTAVVPPPPVKKEEIPLTKEGVNRMISQEEFEAHDDPAHPWFVVSGQGESEADEPPREVQRADSNGVTVYDGSAFLKDHPGGGDSILLVANQDAVSHSGHSRRDET
jgi:nitrate reductase (NAD(P)H)